MNSNGKRANYVSLSRSPSALELRKLQALWSQMRATSTDGHRRSATELRRVYGDVVSKKNLRVSTRSIHSTGDRCHVPEPVVAACDSHKQRVAIGNYYSVRNQLCQLNAERSLLGDQPAFVNVFEYLVNVCTQFEACQPKVQKYFQTDSLVRGEPFTQPAIDEEIFYDSMSEESAMAAVEPAVVNVPLQTPTAAPAPIDNRFQHIVRLINKHKTFEEIIAAYGEEWLQRSATATPNTPLFDDDSMFYELYSIQHLFLLTRHRALFKSGATQPLDVATITALLTDHYRNLETFFANLAPIKSGCGEA